MTTDRNQKYQEIAGQSKYHRLYRNLCNLPSREWRTTFREIESIIGFELPAVARLHRPWWANQREGNGHSPRLLPGASPDGKQPMLTWIQKPCYSGRRRRGLSPADSVSMRYCLSTARGDGRRT